MGLVTRNQLADIYGCTKSNITQQKLPKAKDKNGNTIQFYDLDNKQVKDFIVHKFKKEWIKEYKERHIEEEDEANGLNEKKTLEQINLYKKQGRKLDLQHSKDKKDLHPTHLVAEYIGYIAAGMSTNLLNIGNRVARGDIALRDKIEKEIERGIQKSKEYAAANLKIAGEKMIEELGEDYEV